MIFSDIQKKVKILIVASQIVKLSIRPWLLILQAPVRMGFSKEVRESSLLKIRSQKLKH